VSSLFDWRYYSSSYSSGSDEKKKSDYRQQQRRTASTRAPVRAPAPRTLTAARARGLHWKWTARRHRFYKDISFRHLSRICDGRMRLNPTKLLRYTRWKGQWSQTRLTKNALLLLNLAIIVTKAIMKMILLNRAFSI